MVGREVVSGGTIYCHLLGKAGDLCALLEVVFPSCYDNSSTGLYLKTQYAVIVSAGLVRSDCKILGCKSQAGEICCLPAFLSTFAASQLVERCLPAGCACSWWQLLAGLLWPFCAPSCCFLCRIIALVFRMHDIYCDV